MNQSKKVPSYSLYWEHLFDMIWNMSRGVLDTLTAALDTLAAFDVDTLDDAELHDAVVALGTLSTRLEAQWCRLIARWDANQVWADDGSKAPGARLARETHVRRSDCDRLVRRGRDLIAMPATEAAYAAAEINGRHVDLVASCNREWRNNTFADSEEVLVNLCRTPFFGVAYRSVEYWKQRADLEAADRDADTLHQSRRLSASVTWRGTVAIDGMLDPLGGEVFKTELDRLCDRLRLEDFRDGVERTAQQRRADALVEMAMRSATAPADGLRPWPLLTVTIGIDPFNHLCQTAAGTVIAPGLLMPLLGDADIERIVYDPPNRNISASRRSRFSRAVRRIIEIRDQHCQHFGCDEPAVRCDADHIVPRSQGGITCLCNGSCCAPTTTAASRWPTTRPPCGHHRRPAGRIPVPTPNITTPTSPPPAPTTPPAMNQAAPHPNPVEEPRCRLRGYAGPSISSAAVHGSTSPASTASVSLRQRSSPHCSSARWRTRWARISPSSSRRREARRRSRSPDSVA